MKPLADLFLQSRGKRTDNGEWIEGCYARYETTNPDGTVNKHHLIVPYYASDLYGFYVDPDTIGLCTCMPDRKSVTAFAGDIIKAKHTFLGNRAEFIDKPIRSAYGKTVEKNDILLDVLTYWRNYVVEYSESKGAWIGRNGSDQHELRVLLNSNHEGEIIGNITDNPELLKGEEE